MNFLRVYTEKEDKTMVLKNIKKTLLKYLNSFLPKSFTKQIYKVFPPKPYPPKFNTHVYFIVAGFAGLFSDNSITTYLRKGKST